MKSSFLIVILSAMTFLTIDAQKTIYPLTWYMGYSPQQTFKLPYLLINRDLPNEEFLFGLKESTPQLHYGLRVNIPFSHPFFGTLGVEYTQLKQTFYMTMTHAPLSESNYEMTATTRSLVLPAGIGVRMGALEITSALQAQYSFQSSLDGVNMMAIEASKPKLGLGWNAGAAVHLGNTQFGITYQAFLDRHGSNLTHRGKTMELLSVPGNVMFSVGFSF